MNKRFTTKGAGWLPDDIASIIFALLLILVAFVIFGKVNELVADRNAQDVLEMHDTLAHQQLLRVVLASTITIDGEEKTTSEFVAEYMVATYLLEKNLGDDTLKARKELLDKELIGNPLVTHQSIEYLLNNYQLAPSASKQTLTSLSGPSGRSSLFTISILDYSTQQKLKPIFYSDAMPKASYMRQTLTRERSVQATAFIPLPSSYKSYLNNHIIIFEIYEPDKIFLRGY